MNGVYFDPAHDGCGLFFSSLAFAVLEKAMALIFSHRNQARKRHFLVSAILPYCLVVVLAIALLLLSLGALALQALAGENLFLFGQRWSLSGVAGFLFPFLGMALISLVLAAIYLIVPVGRTRLRHALVGGLAGALLWEMLRHGLIWYFATISKIGLVYGSLATAVVLLFCMELAAALLLLGLAALWQQRDFAAQSEVLTAQVAAEFLGVSRRLLSVWTCRRIVPSVRVTARFPLYDLDELGRWIEARRVPARGEGVAP
jgi:uncharacterized BrkB/YihY/UPF0761 family membrane protein